MRVVFIGCVEFSFSALEHSLSLADFDLVGVVTRRSSSFNADFRSLEPLAEKEKVPCIIANANNQDELARGIVKLKPEVIYCFGWSYLLRKKILDIPPLGVIGYHPAALPKNRGRHPLIWALVLELTETASTFFFMDEGADSGDILDQRRIEINPTDDAASLYHKMTFTALEQITDFTQKLASGRFIRRPQDHSQANYWRKRTQEDGQIDWRMSARNIHNLVRALTKPYIGAHCLFQGNEVKVWKTEVVESSDQYQNIEPGKILSVDGLFIVVKCGEGLIKLVRHDFASPPGEGTYL